MKSDEEIPLNMVYIRPPFGQMLFVESPLTKMYGLTYSERHKEDEVWDCFDFLGHKRAIVLQNLNTLLVSYDALED